MTAEQLRSYKPGHAHFLAAPERLGVKPRERILHVAQSSHGDIPHLHALGYSTVWVNRRRGKEGSVLRHSAMHSLMLKWAASRNWRILMGIV
ncbi:MAG: hypothetical protein U0176_07915 [Bacteroidia bacterium]